MATLYTQASHNVAKTWLLMSLFLCIVIALGWFLSFYYQSPGILYIAVIISILMNIAGYWYSDKIALSLSHAKAATKEEYLDLWNVTENLAITAGLPMPRLYVINDPAPNAFATGRDKNHAALAVTTGLLALLDRSELEGVIAHELSHVGNRDILLSTVVVVLVGFISIISDIFLRTRIFGGRRSSDREEGGGILVIIGIIFMVLSPIFATLIQLAISRKREFLADASGALLTRYPEGLASALKKISMQGRPMMYKSRATAHLFISDPYSEGRAPKKMNAFAKLWSTHPPVEERVEALVGHQ